MNDLVPKDDLPDVVPSSDLPRGFFSKALDVLKGTGANLAAGAFDANAAVFEKLSKGAKKVSDITGMPTGGAFEKGAQEARSVAQNWRRKAAESGANPESIPSKIYQGIGSAPMGIAEFTAGVPYAVATGAMEGGVSGGIKKGLERFAVGKVFHGIDKTGLSPIKKAAAMGGTMGLQTAAEGASPQDIAASTITGIALSAPGATNGRAETVKANLIKAGVQPKIAADLAAKTPESSTPQMGYVTHERDPYQFANSDIVPKEDLPHSEYLPPRTDETVIQPKTETRIMDSENIPDLNPLLRGEQVLNPETTKPEETGFQLGEQSPLQVRPDIPLTEGEIVPPEKPVQPIIEGQQAPAGLLPMPERGFVLKPHEGEVIPPEPKTTEPPVINGQIVPAGLLDYKTNDVAPNPNRINFEIGLVKNKKTSKTAVLLPPSIEATEAKIIAKNAKLRALKQGDEIYLYDPAQIPESTLRDQIRKGKNGLALGYGTDSVPADGVPYAVDLDGHGTVSPQEILDLRDTGKLGFSGVAPDMETAVKKIREMGRDDAQIRGQENKIDTESRKAPQVTPDDQVTMDEINALNDVPTTEIMQEAISAVGPEEFRRLATEKLNKYTANGKYQVSEAMITEATAREIVAKNRRGSTQLDQTPETVPSPVSVEKVETPSAVAPPPSSGEVSNPDVVMQGQMNKNGISYIYNGNGSFTVKDVVTGKEIGRADVADDGNKDYLSNVRVDPAYQRRGIATNLYDYIERTLDKKLRPSPTNQTPDGKAFWAKRSGANEIYSAGNSDGNPSSANIGSDVSSRKTDERQTVDEGPQKLSPAKSQPNKTATPEPQNNASGQTDVSLEATNELKSRQKQGIKTVIIDTRSGKERPAIGIRPEDNTINPYEVMQRQYPDGRAEVLQSGNKAKPLLVKSTTNKTNAPRNILSDIRQQGGINTQSLIDALDRNEIYGPKGGNRYLRVTGKNGVGVDQMAMQMRDEGWQVPLDVDGRVDTQAFADMLKEAVNGNHPVHPNDVETMLDRFPEIPPEDHEAVLHDIDEAASKVMTKQEAQNAIKSFEDFFAKEFGDASATEEKAVSGSHEGEISGTSGSEYPTRFERTDAGDQGILLNGNREFGKSERPKKAGRAVGTSELMDGFTSEEKIQPSLLHAGIHPAEIKRGIMAATSTIKSTGAGKALSEAIDGIQAAVMPTARSEAAKLAGADLIEGMGRKSHETEKFAADLDRAVKEDGKKITRLTKLKDAIESSSRTLADRVFSKMPEALRIDFMQKMDVGEKQSTPELQRIADSISAMFADKAKQVQELGTGALENVRENYFPHMWERGEDAQKAISIELSKRPLEGSKAFTKARVFDDVATGIAAGYKPISTNPIDLVFLKMGEMDKYILAHKALQSMESEGVAHLIPAGEKVPDGYTDINGRYGFVDRDGQKYRYVAQDDVAQVVNNYLSQNLYSNKYVGKIYQGYMGTANTLNQFQLGVGSAFHAGFTSAESVISHTAIGIKALLRGDLKEAAKYFVEAPVAWVKNPMLGNKIMDAWTGENTSADVAPIVQWLEMAGARKGNTNERFFTNHTQKMIEAWTNGKQVRAAVETPLAAVEQMARPIIEWLVPRQKFGVFGEMANDWFSRNQDATHEQTRAAMQQIWNRVDSRLGQVVYDRLFAHNVAKNIAQGLIRAPGWTGGTIIEVGGGLKDLANMLANPKRSGKGIEISDRAAYTLSLMAVTAVINGSMTAMFTGEKPKGMDFLAFRTGGLDATGKPERFMLPTYVKDLYSYASHPAKTLLDKTHPLISLAGDIIRNKDYFGVEIADPDANLAQRNLQRVVYAAKAFVPFWMRGTQKNIDAEGGLDLATEKGNLLETTVKTVAPLVGVMPAPSAYTKTDLEKFMTERLPKMDTAIKPEKSERGKAVAMLANAYLNRQREGKETKPVIDKARELLKQGKLHMEDIDRLVDLATEPRIERQFKRLSYENTIHAFVEHSTPDERAQLLDAFIDKMGTFAEKHPEDFEKMLPLIEKAKELVHSDMGIANNLQK